MRKGYLAFITGDYANAISQWKQVYSSKTNDLAVMAAFNIALSYEFMDDILSAEEWLLNAEALKKTKNTAEYLKIIRNRVKDKNVLDKLLN